MMYAISIIPVDTEIRSGRFQSCKTADGLIGIAGSGRIGILRHAPDTLNAVILCHKFFHHIHVRAIRSHRNIDHLNAEILGNGKMTVITRYRAKELHFI